MSVIPLSNFLWFILQKMHFNDVLIQQLPFFDTNGRFHNFNQNKSHFQDKHLFYQKQGKLAYL